MTLSAYILLASSSLFVIVDPLAAVPAFIAMTPQDSRDHRIRMARLACCVMAGVLIAFALAGKVIFRLLGITMPAFQLAASIVLLLVALDMLRARRSPRTGNFRRNRGRHGKDGHCGDPSRCADAGGSRRNQPPSCLKTKASGIEQKIALCGCICAIAMVSYLILRLAAEGARWLIPS